MQKDFIEKVNGTYFNEKVGLWWLVKSLLSWGLLTYNQSIHNIKPALTASKSLQIARNTKWGYLQYMDCSPSDSLLFSCFQLFMWRSLMRFSMRWFSPCVAGELGGELGDMRDGIGGEEGGVQQPDGDGEDQEEDPREPKELWDPRVHGDQLWGSFIGGEGGPGFVWSISALPLNAEKVSLAQRLPVPIMLIPIEVPLFKPSDACVSMPCLMLCCELLSRGLLSLRKKICQDVFILNGRNESGLPHLYERQISASCVCFLKGGQVLNKTSQWLKYKAAL